MPFEINRWFRGPPAIAKPATPSHVETPRPSDYRPDLIPILRAEHRELMALFLELDCASKRDDGQGCRVALSRFTKLLQHHLLTENRHLYGYFSRHTDPGITRQIKTMSTEMMYIGKALHRFISTYTRAQWTLALQQQLQHDISWVGGVLARRIQEEEAVLYPLYVSPSS